MAFTITYYNNAYQYKSFYHELKSSNYYSQTIVTYYSYVYCIYNWKLLLNYFSVSFIGIKLPGNEVCLAKFICILWLMWCHKTFFREVLKSIFIDIPIIEMRTVSKQSMKRWRDSYPWKVNQNNLICFLQKLQGKIILILTIHDFTESLLWMILTPVYQLVKNGSKPSEKVSFNSETMYATLLVDLNAVFEGILMLTLHLVPIMVLTRCKGHCIWVHVGDHFLQPGSQPSDTWSIYSI